MKKTISINIAGMNFMIDEDAYKILKAYLKSIETRYAREMGTEEIIEDIESRIAEELKKQQNSYKEVITVSDINRVITLLGRVEDFENEENPQRSFANHQPKRLYRNPDDVVIAGVASGLAMYFGVDTVLIRLLFVIFVFAGGFAIPLYLILWLITPKAITPTQKAQMRGEPLTLEKIVHEVKESVEKGKQRFGM